MVVKSKKVVFTLVILLLLAIGVALFFRAPNEQEISSALESTRIEYMSFHEASPSEAANFVIDCFHRQHPEMRMVRLIQYDCSAGKITQFDAKDDWSPKVTLDLRSIPASEAFKYVAAISNLVYTVRDGRVYLSNYSSFRDGHLPPVTARERLIARMDSFLWRLRGGSSKNFSACAILKEVST